ncbi:Rz-like spanin [Xylella phage Prado]|uniref:O-spanin n=1 Tax=Xylella phage Prado TaxID=1415146 RepID=V5Q7T9_9CAUD|nr:Rz-like spanin [Xylella phage Prado]AHB12199.1 o-spanin [Xylella phage Prado]
MPRSIKPLPAVLSGLTSLFLLMSLTSCVTIPAPPAQYLEDCAVTYLTKENPSNSDVAKLAIDREFDVKLCNVDKRALRAWYDGYKQACGWRCKVEK